MRAYVFKSIQLAAVVISRGGRSMILSASRWLCLAVLSPVTSCLAVTSNEAQPTMSPASTFDSVPRCASDCIRKFVRTEYPKNACSNGQDFSCLCRTRAKNGFTLGEAALQCSFSTCSMAEAVASNSYGICDAVSGAARGTHSTITATVVAVTRTTTTMPPVTTAPSSTMSNSTRSSKGEHTSVRLTSFQSPLTVTTATQDPSSTTSADATPPQGTSSGSRLNAGAVIGVSVASGVSGFFILGVIIFFCCRKMRRNKERSSFFEIGGLMSEPSNFTLPTRPTPSPEPPSHAVREISRPLPPLQRPAPHPTLTVTSPEHDYDEDRRGYGTLGKTAFAYSSTSDLNASPTQSSPRTVSDLLPDKPGLYPEPLRWSQHKSPRPNSGETLFEEDAARPRSILGAPNRPQNFSVPDRQWSRPAVVGLPVNPRAMMHGFRGPGNGALPQGHDYRRKPVFANAGEKLQHPRQADVCQPTYGYPDRPYDYIGDYWDNTGGYSDHSAPSSSQSAARRSFHAPVDYVEDHFETININDHSEPRRTSRHSGSFKPLPPVREVRTPVNNAAQRADYFDENAPVQYPRTPLPGAVSSNREIISRPRIVRQDDIKRVHIRRGKPQSKASAVPYSPEDYWLGRDGGSPSRLRPYDQHRMSGGYRQPPYKLGRVPPKKSCLDSDPRRARGARGDFPGFPGERKSDGTQGW